MKIIGFKHPLLSIDELCTQKGQYWCLYGDNRSGINCLLDLLEHRLTGHSAQALDFPQPVSIVSFALQQELFEAELRNDDSDFLDRPDPGTPARDFLPTGTTNAPLIDQFNMRQVMTTGYRHLSSGQSRKLLLLRALLSDASLIVIDSPYDGLDQLTCRELDRCLAAVGYLHAEVVTIVRNREDIPPWATHLGYFRNNQLLIAGSKSMVEPQLLRHSTDGNNVQLFQDAAYSLPPSRSHIDFPEDLIQLIDGFANYGPHEVFSGLNLTIRQGQHTLVTGPNGSGKSTLLQIITGDNTKCYANDLSIFGIQRGSGESVWELKKHMGIVSPDLHRSYRVPGSILQVVLSGYYDSIGLYNHPTEQQRKEASRWLRILDMANNTKAPFRSLSYGDQRLVLIARALVKRPVLLILDEPTQGLDSDSRRLLLDFLERIAAQGLTTLLYVSHRRDEYRAFFRQHIRLEEYSRTISSTGVYNES